MTRRNGGTGSVHEHPKESGRWRYEFKIFGVRYRAKCTGCTSREQAEAYMLECLQQKRQELGLDPVVVPEHVPSRAVIAIDIIRDMEEEREGLLRIITTLQAEIRRVRGAFVRNSLT